MSKKGFTTGSCAQAAARACALMLKKGDIIDSVDVELPNGEIHTLPIIKQEISSGHVRCAVIKDSGEEDKDVTNGIEIFCEIRERKEPGIFLKGGRGVGKVTRPGLAVNVGEYAINPVPRKMIIKEVGAIHELPLREGKGFEVIVSVPQGEEIAKKTSNPRLGITGGISIIGTSGLVKAKSAESFKQSLKVEINVAKHAGYKTLFIVSGYLGERFLLERFGVAEQQMVRVADHVGFALKQCMEKGFSKALVIGHIGKMAKVAAGLFNTHSRTGDARLETVAAYAASRGAEQGLVKEILNLELAEATIDLLRDNDLMVVFDDIADKVVERCSQYCEGKLELATIILSLKGKVIGKYPQDILQMDFCEKKPKK